MSIKKMLLLASMSLAAIAFAAPAVAQADVTLTDPKNVPLEPGAEITATSTDLTTTQSTGGVLTCQLVTLHFEVKTNNDEHVLLEQLGLATTTGCLANGVLPVTITNGGIVPDEEGKRTLTINTWGTAEATSTFISEVFSLEDPEHKEPLQTCDYEGDLHIVGVESGGDKIEVTKSPLTAPGCPNADIEGTFTLETSDPENTPVTIDFVKTG